MAAHIETLNDLFAALFRPAEGAPAIRQPQRPLREDLFALFFPDALVKPYADKSKSNLTWFFNHDPRNKSVRRSLAALLEADLPGTVADTHRKCHAALWPRAGQPAFDGALLKSVLLSVRLPAGVESRWHIVTGEGERPGRVEVFLGVDEAAALARLILTLAVAGDAPLETVGDLWRGDLGGDCAFLGEDATLAGSLRHARMLDLQGRHEKAFEAFERVAKQLNRPARTLDESTMYVRLGEMCFTGEGCLRDEKLALRYDALGLLEENPRSLWQLGRHATGSPAREAMEKAAELGYGPAIRELGDAWNQGSARLATVRNLEEARRCYQRGLGLPGGDGAYCAYMLGRLYEAQGERAAAVNAYRVAQESGSAEAAERLARLDWMLEAPKEVPVRRPALPGEKRFCLMNDLTGANRVFLEGLEGRWDVTVCGEAAGAPEGAKVSALAPEAALRDLAQGVYWGGAASFPELVIGLLSGDQRKNLRQAVALLGELQRMAQDLGDRAWDLVDQVELYVLAEHDYAALLLDAAFAGMGELYFRLRLCDPALDAADALLTEAPLFLPRLSAAPDAPVRVKVIGGGDAALAVARRAMALPLPEGIEATLDVYGEGAARLEQRLRQLCPGLERAPELMGLLPRFHECAYDGVLSEEGLLGGDYYVVATGDDARNLRVAVLLRGALLRREPGAEKPPFIAVHTPGALEGWLVGSLPAGLEGGGKAAGWCAQYELHPFGMASMYRAQALRDDALERRARQAHMLFIGLPNTRDARHAALGSYYRRQHSRDVARAAAGSLAYRLHLAGIDLPGWRLYGAGDEVARLGMRYSKWLKEGENLDKAVRDEHARRNRLLIALGWSPAAVEEVAAYVGRGNPSHILYPAKLNPFICPWEALEGGELLRGVREAVRARFPEKSVADPRKDEEASVRDTEAVIGG